MGALCTLIMTQLLFCKYQRILTDGSQNDNITSCIYAVYLIRLSVNDSAVLPCYDVHFKRNLHALDIGMLQTIDLHDCVLLHTQQYHYDL